jgi:hypothetical protein
MNDECPRPRVYLNSRSQEDEEIIVIEFPFFAKIYQKIAI